ncbi:MAG: septum formation initiator family protein [Chitinophagaceae bacterium]|jgi:cell division protein FtsB|nr:septum formation initiator family protein [Chitinophagaceae bacterium]
MNANLKHKAQTRTSTPERLWTRSLSRIPNWLKSKYFLSFGVFTAWMLFFDRNDLITQHHRNSEYKQLTDSKKYYLDKINAENEELQKLKFNPYTLEKYAREKYYMKRANEDLYIIDEVSR